MQRRWSMDWKKLVKEKADEVMVFFKKLGGKFKEEVYEEAFVHELRLSGIPYLRQRNTEIIYKGYTVGTKKPDCIINPGGKVEGGEYLVEMKTVKNITKGHRMQAMVYMLSLDIENGCVLNFNPYTMEAEIEPLTKPQRILRKDIVQPGEKAKGKLSDILKECGEEVYSYLGNEFLYAGTDIYVNAVAVELRLRGINFHSSTYPLLYKGHRITDYSYNYVFEDGSVAVIFDYEKEEDINDYIEELNIYNQINNIKKGYLLALPKKEGLDVKVIEI